MLVSSNSLIACLVFGLAVVSTARSEKVFWRRTDSTGKHKVRAKLDSVEVGRPVLILQQQASKVKIALGD